MKRNNKGYSFIELIITMAIFSIVMLAIIMMMRTSLVSYKNGLFETTMQEEAQISANQISDLLIDATYIVSQNNTLGSESYTFKGPDGQFTLSHETVSDADGNIESGSLYYIAADGSKQLLSDQMKEFKIDGLQKRAADDKTTVYDNAATVNVGILYQGRTFEATQDTYFRNNVEDKSSETEEFNPFGVENAPVSNPNPSGSGLETAEVLRYKPFDISAEYDIVADAQLSTSAAAVFQLKDTDNTTIKNPLSGMTVRHYTIDVNDSYKSTTGWSLYTPSGSQDYYVTGKNSKNQDVKILLHLDAVSFDVGSGIFADYREADVNENGYPTNVKVKGIHVNEALKPTAQGGGGLNIKYTITLKKNGTKKGEASDQTLSYNSDSIADKANGVPQLSPLDLKLGLIPDPVSGGFVISSSNGYRVDQKQDKADLSNGDGDQTLTVTFKVNDTSMSGLTINYKYYVTGNSLEHAN